MFTSPSPLPESSRTRIVDALNARLADGLDLASGLKVAHWNLRGPQFAALHPLFGAFATALEGINDDVAERVVTLGGRALGTVRHVASASSLPEYPQETTRDSHHTRLLVDRIDGYLRGVRAARVVADELDDIVTTDLLTSVVATFEKNHWMLRASLET
jgi:starvation-inducible DNA-binding protein